MSRTMKINNETFELTIPRKQVHAIEREKWDNMNAIFRCYDRPSIYKEQIWNEWYLWAIETTGIRSFYISGHNCMQFTISGLYEDEHGNLYNLYITRDHNRAILVNA